MEGRPLNLMVGRGNRISRSLAHRSAELALAEDKDLLRQVLDRKRKGEKTEPAWASVLQLHGDPYDAMQRLGEDPLELRTQRLYHHVTQDPSFREQDFLQKVEAAKAEPSPKNLADVEMSYRWLRGPAQESARPARDALLGGGDTAPLLSDRLGVLEDRLKTTGSLWGKKTAFFLGRLVQSHA